jgi:hypothetical protein
VKREHIEQQSHLQIIATQLFRDEQRNPEFFSALDRRLVNFRFNLNMVEINYLCAFNSRVLAAKIASVKHVDKAFWTVQDTGAS